MNLFAVSGLILSLICSVLVIVTLTYGRKKIHRIMALFNLVVGLWGLGALLIGLSSTPQTALLNSRIALSAVIFIPVLWIHAVYVFCNLQKKYILIAIYMQALFFLTSNITGPLFIKDVRPFFGFFWLVPGPLFTPFLILWLVITGYSFYELIIRYYKSGGTAKMQIKYFFLASFVGFAGGSTNFLPPYGLDIYPFGNFIIWLYCVIMTYAIIRYHLLDIRIIITRIGIFLTTYTLVLSVPLYIGYRTQSWLISTSLAVILATLSPLIYRFLQRKAEDVLYAQHRRYREMLLDSIQGMEIEHNLERLFKFIVYIVKKTLRISCSAIFFHDMESKTYVLKAETDQGINLPQVLLEENHPLVDYMKKSSSPFTFDELSEEFQDYLEKKAGRHCTLLIPLVNDGQLMGVLTLGEKLDNSAYSPDDINVFKILSQQATLAIENCIFLEEYKENQRRICEADKWASLGGMAYGVAHQLKNRLNYFSLDSAIINTAIDNFVKSHPRFISQHPGIKSTFDSFSEIAGSLTVNVQRTDGVINSILSYARTTKKEPFFEEFPLKETLNIALELLQMKHHVASILLHEKLGSVNIIYGIKTQLMEILYNLLDNAYEATKQYRTCLPEEQRSLYTPQIVVKAEETHRSYIISVSDNGIGIKEEDRERIFTPFFTTKSSFRSPSRGEKSGTGIGTYIVKRLIEENHRGKVWVESEHLKGSTFYVELPKKEQLVHNETKER